MFIIETRTAETDTRAAGDWHSDGISETGDLAFDSETEAQDALRQHVESMPRWERIDHEFRIVQR